MMHIHDLRPLSFTFFAYFDYYHTSTTKQECKPFQVKNIPGGAQIFLYHGHCIQDTFILQSPKNKKGIPSGMP